MSQPTYTDVTLKYCDQASYDATASVVAYNCYRANSLFDPDFTAAGHQPLGYDQWSALYYCWVVPYCDVEMTVTPGSTATQGVKFGILWQTTSTIVSTDVVTLSELAFSSKTAFFVPDAGRPITLRARVPTWRMFGLDQQDYLIQGPNGFGGCTDTNPARCSYVFTWVGTTLSTNEPAAVNVNVKITYAARFTSAIPNTASLLQVHQKPDVHALAIKEVDDKDLEAKETMRLVALGLPMMPKAL